MNPDYGILSDTHKADEYRKTIAKDPALDRRFQPVIIEEPTVESTISILRGLKSRYEVHHGVEISDAALVTAAVYGARYISDRFLPDKAIGMGFSLQSSNVSDNSLKDLVDEAASALRLAQESKPDELEALDRDIITLQVSIFLVDLQVADDSPQIELESLKNESDVMSVERRTKVEAHLERKRRKAERLSGLWYAGTKKIPTQSIATKICSRTDTSGTEQGNQETVGGCQA